MKANMKAIYQVLVGLLIVNNVAAVNSVHPTGVNVNATGVTSVHLTYRGTAGQVSKDAFWCGEITGGANIVSTTNPCIAGTFFGRLPQVLSQTRVSAGAPVFSNNKRSQQKKAIVNGQNLTDIMTIPASVARRAMQSARAGNNSSFFYIRKFESAGQSQYIAVTCRMSDGGARVPFALTEVHPFFVIDETKQSVNLAYQGQLMPKIQAEISYNGSGRLKGRWEVVLPGDPQPSEFDLTPQANLPIEQRGLQKRFTVLAHFDVFLPPLGQTILKGPKRILIPNRLIGPYQIILRIEATRDKEADSNTGVGNVNSGGLAGFTMPVLRYYVATEDDVLQARIEAGLDKSIRLFEPTFELATNTLNFSWLRYGVAETYKLEIKAQDQPVFTALIDGWETYYQPPPWIIEQLKTTPSQWRVAAFDSQGKKVGFSQWRRELQTSFIDTEK